MPATEGALVILIFYLLPGFIIDRLLSQNFVRGKRETTEIVVGAVFWSLVHYAVCWTIVMRLVGVGDWDKVALAVGSPRWALILLVLPLIEAVLIARLVGTHNVARFMRFLGFRIHPIPKSWDYVFSRAEGYLVLATLSDGSRIGGRVGFASSFPNDEDLYLDETWKLADNGAFLEPMPMAGALLKRSDIRILELYEIKEVAIDEQQRAS